MGRLSGRGIIITGATGIAAASARRFAAEGAAVVGVEGSDFTGVGFAEGVVEFFRGGFEEGGDFDAGFPLLTSAIAIWAVWRFPITEAKAREVRQELESRRGKA